MANKLRGETPLILGDKEHTLRPTFEAIEIIEDRFGGLADICTRFREGKWKVTEICGIAGALLRKEKLGTAALNESIMEAGPVVVGKDLYLCLLCAWTGTTLDEMNDDEGEPEGNDEAPTETET